MAGSRPRDLRWRTSSASGSGECVEVAFNHQGDVLLRHSKEPDGPVLRFTGAEWQAFTAGVRAGEFDH